MKFSNRSIIYLGHSEDDEPIFNSVVFSFRVLSKRFFLANKVEVGYHSESYQAWCVNVNEAEFAVVSFADLASPWPLVLRTARTGETCVSARVGF